MIELEPPYREHGRDGDVALKRALMFGRTATMTRWHIPRSGVLRGNAFRTFTVWCSAIGMHPDRPRNPTLMVDEITDGVPVCGTCVGRARGAGHEIPVIEVQHVSDIVYEPRHIRIPRSCPGAARTDFIHVNVFVGRCPACKEYMPIRGGNRGYDWTPPKLRQHEPGPGLVDPCPFHMWDRITPEGVCSCGAPSIKATPRNPLLAASG